MIPQFPEWLKNRPLCEDYRIGIPCAQSRRQEGTFRIPRLIFDFFEVKSGDVHYIIGYLGQGGIKFEDRKGITYVELNVDLELINEFRGALFFSHTNRRLFPSVRVPTGPAPGTGASL